MKMLESSLNLKDEFVNSTVTLKCLFKKIGELYHRRQSYFPRIEGSPIYRAKLTDINSTHRKVLKTDAKAQRRWLWQEKSDGEVKLTAGNKIRK